MAGRSTLHIHSSKELSGRPKPSSRREAVEHLNHLTHSSTRWALFAIGERWTAVLTNLRDGSDFADQKFLVADICRARVCRVVDHDGGWRDVGGYRVRDGYPARIFELVEPDRESFGDVARSIYASLDGDRWTFATRGDTPFPIEARFDYDARLKRDRFTSKNLCALLASLGLVAAVPEAFESAGSFYLIDERLANEKWRTEVEANACTPDQADDPGYAYLRRGLKWVAHIETHSTSVVWDLTRAVLLNAQLRRDAQPHLDARLEDGWATKSSQR